jgi:SAM-dependent methyltransferase
MKAGFVHNSSYIEMDLNIRRYLNNSGVVCDIGSCDVNGCYRPLFHNMDIDYIGIDLCSGKNVDHVMLSEYNTGLLDNCASAVISGQVLEHCKNPFRLVDEIYRICKPDAYCLLVAPFIWKEHKYPVDCWRFLPDGMKELLSQSGFKVVDAYLNGNDCWGIGQK